MPDIARALAAGRARATQILTDTGTLTLDADRNDDATLDPTALTLTDPADAETLWTGPCLLLSQSRSGSGSEVPVGPDTTTAVVQYRARLPYDAPVPPRGAVLTLTASLDAGLVGVPMRVVATDLDSFGIFRTLHVEPVVV